MYLIIVIWGIEAVVIQNLFLFIYSSSLCGVNIAADHVTYHSNEVLLICVIII